MGLFDIFKKNKKKVIVEEKISSLESDSFESKPFDLKGMLSSSDFDFKCVQLNSIRTEDEVLNIDRKEADLAFKKSKKEILDIYMYSKGFIKYKNVAYIRLNKNGLLEFINLQKCGHGSKTFCVNFYIKPLFKEAEGIGERLAKYICGHDLWWDFKDIETANKSFENVSNAIDKYLIPWFDRYEDESNYEKDLLEEKYGRLIDKEYSIIYYYIKNKDLKAAKNFINLAEDKYGKSISDWEQKVHLKDSRKHVNKVKHMNELLDSIKDIDDFLKTSTLDIIEHLGLPRDIIEKSEFNRKHRFIKPTKFYVGDMYAVWHPEIEKYSVKKVLTINKNRVEFAYLPNYYEELPKIDDLETTNAVVTDGWIDGTDMHFNNVPKKIVYLGNSKVVAEGEISCVSVSTQLYNGLIENYQRKETSKRFREDSSNKTKYLGKKLNIEGILESIDLGTINIELNDNIDIEFDDLFKLPMLNIITYTGFNNDLLVFLERNNNITSLILNNHKQKCINISKTNIRSLKIEVTGLEKIILSNNTKNVELLGDFSKFRDIEVIMPNKGSFLRVDIEENKEMKVPNLHLDNLKHLNMGANKIDISSVSKFYPNLKELRIFGNPGFIFNVKEILGLKELYDLELLHLFGFSEDDMPQKDDMPNLDFIYMYSVPKEAGMFMKKEFKDRACLEISGLRDENWLKENLNNPFSNWLDNEEISKTNSQRAFDAYKELLALVEGDVEYDIERKGFEDFIEVFNKIEKKTECIETLEREEIYDAYDGLAQKSQLKYEVLMELFDEIRVF